MNTRSVANPAAAVDAALSSRELIAIAKEMAAQWRMVDKLVTSGKLIPKAQGWYEASDVETFRSVGKIVKSIKMGPKHRLRFKLSRPNKRLMSLADRYSQSL